MSASLRTELSYLPSYSPNQNRIERLRRFVSKEALYRRRHATFADFQIAIEETLNQLPPKQKENIFSLITLNYQVFDNVSLLAM